VVEGLSDVGGSVEAGAGAAVPVVVDGLGGGAADVDDDETVVGDDGGEDVVVAADVVVVVTCAVAAGANNTSGRAANAAIPTPLSRVGRTAGHFGAQSPSERIVW
jgi:hypothetical protein